MKKNNRTRVTDADMINTTADIELMLRISLSETSFAPSTFEDS